MSFTVVDCEQRSPEWFAARLGRLTGSRASDMLAMLKDGKTEAAARRNLRVELALERITGKAQEGEYTSAAMRQGMEREPDAAALYEALSGRLLEKTGFLRSDTHMAGCSLDGHIGDFEGIVEIKCPLPATHLEYLRTGKIPSEYRSQITHNLWISGAQWCDWLSYNPDFPDALQAKLVRVTRTEFEIMSYQRAVEKFLAEVDSACLEIRQLEACAGVPVF